MHRPVRLSLALLVPALLVLAAVAPPPRAFSQVQDGATLTVLRGQVAVIRADGSAVQPAPSGTTVRSGDEIRTLNRTGALITFFTGTEIEMGQDTILVVDRVSVDGSKVDISLKQVLGSTLNRVQSLTDPNSSYRIEAGGAVAVVRGTTFLLIGPVSTSRGDIAALVCLDDCDGRTTFSGCSVMPYTSFGVSVSKGRAAAGCETAPVDRGADYFNAGFEAITTFEQAFASQSGDQSPGLSNPGRDDGQRRADERNQRDEPDKNNAPIVPMAPPLLASAPGLVACNIAGGPVIPPVTPTLFGGIGSVVEGNSGTTTLQVPVLLLPAATSPVTVNFATGGGNATPGSDYAATSGTLTFPPGTTSQNISITVNGDVAPETDEIVIVSLSNPAGATLTGAIAIGSIVDDDSPINVSVVGDSVFEGDAGTVNLPYTITLSRTSASPVTVSFQTTTVGSATPGVDFTAVPVTPVTIPANTRSVTVNVPIIGDTAVESDETVFVQLSTSSPGVNILVPTAIGTILDDDGPRSVAISLVSNVTEGCPGTTTTMRFTVQLSRAGGTPVTVNFTTANGTATAGSDYIAQSGTVTFAPGQTLHTIDVQVIGDAVPEPDETLLVNLTSATGATIAVPSATGSILNDD